MRDAHDCSEIFFTTRMSSKISTIMAQYTRSAAEQFRPEESSVGWLWNIFIFSIVVFGSVVFLYAGMEFGYGSFLKNESKQIQGDIDKLKDEITTDDQRELAEFYSQVYNVNQLIPKHLIISQLFDFLEANTNTSVYYTNFDISNTGNKSSVITLQGKTRSFELVARQLEALRQRPEINEVTLNTAQKEETNVTFTLRVLLNPEFLLNK